MKKSLFLYIILLSSIFACKEKTEVIKPSIIVSDEVTAPFKIEILDNEGLDVIDPNSEIEVIATGFTWTEGPLWVDSENFLLFSDIPNNKVFKWDPTNSATSLYLQPSGLSPNSPLGNESGSNGLLLDPQGQLVLMQHGDRRVARMNAPLSAPDENYISLVDNYKGKRLNSPNDGFYDKAGNLYFTDPPYGLPAMMNDPNKELSFQGVYCLLANGELRLLDSLTKPNGLTLSPDGDRMYVAVSDSSHAVWYTYDIEAPGQVANKEIFHDLTYLVAKPGQQGLPDGLKINQKGYVFATGAGGIWIFNPSGKPLARIYTGQLTANCSLGHNEKNLFMTADDHILSVPLK